jgi:uncharacterized membrane protein
MRAVSFLYLQCYFSVFHHFYQELKVKTKKSAKINVCILTKIATLPEFANWQTHSSAVLRNSKFGLKKSIFDGNI